MRGAREKASGMLCTLCRAHQIAVFVVQVLLQEQSLLLLRQVSETKAYRQALLELRDADVVDHILSNLIKEGLHLRMIVAQHIISETRSSGDMRQTLTFTNFHLRLGHAEA